MSLGLSPTHKIERAKVHLDALDQAIKAWQKSQPEAFSSYDDVERGEYVVEILPPDTDVSFALLAGDFVSCLRASLDHLVWHIAATRGTPNKRICFPIYGETSMEAQISITKSTLGIPDEAAAVIRSFQPYNAGDAYKLHYLWILNTLWNIDKHRHIPLHSAVTNYRISAPRPLRVDTCDDHMKVFFSIADKSKVKLNPSTDAQIIFGDETEGVAVTINDFRTIYKAVIEKVMPAVLA